MAMTNFNAIDEEQPKVSVEKIKDSNGSIGDELTLSLPSSTSTMVGLLENADQVREIEGEDCAAAMIGTSNAKMPDAKVGRLIETGKELISTSTVGTQTDDDDDAPYFVAVAIASIFTTFFTALFFFLEVFCAVLDSFLRYIDRIQYEHENKANNIEEEQVLDTSGHDNNTEEEEVLDISGHDNNTEEEEVLDISGHDNNIEEEQVLDTSGFISGSEWKELITSMSFELSDAQIETLFKEGDTDGDGKICYEEFTAMLQKLQGDDNANEP